MPKIKQPKLTYPGRTGAPGSAVCLEKGNEITIGVCIPVYNAVGNLNLASAVWSIEQCSDLPYQLSLGISPNCIAKNRIKAEKRIGSSIRHILALDDDVIVAPYYASKMAKVLIENPDIGIVSAIMMGPRGEKQNGLHPENIGPGEIVDAMIPGTCIMYDRERTPIKWDTAYKHSQWEDTDAVLQVRGMGFRTVALGDVQIMHRNNAMASGKLPPFWDENKKYFLSKWGEEALS